MWAARETIGASMKEIIVPIDETTRLLYEYTNDGRSYIRFQKWMKVSVGNYVWATKNGVLGSTYFDDGQGLSGFISAIARLEKLLVLQ
jgi:hypothetical protein